MIQLAFVSILVGAITCLLLAANGFLANKMDGFDDCLLSGKLVDNFALLQR